MGDTNCHIRTRLLQETRLEVGTLRLCCVFVCRGISSLEVFAMSSEVVYFSRCARPSIVCVPIVLTNNLLRRCSLMQWVSFEVMFVALRIYTTQSLYTVQNTRTSCVYRCIAVVEMDRKCTERCWMRFRQDQGPLPLLKDTVSISPCQHRRKVRRWLCTYLYNSCSHMDICW